MEELNMKKIVFFVLPLLFCLGACSEFLDTKSMGAANVNNYFNNDQEAIDIVKILYSDTADEARWGRDIFWEQCGANDVVFGRTYPELYPLSTLTMGTTEKYQNWIYSKCYSTMATAQWIIVHLEEKKAKTPLTEIETRTLGEAYFFRAFLHFTIAYRHGLGDLGVPYKPWEEYENGYNNEIPPQQPSVIDNYMYILSDFKKAEEYLPWKGSIEATYGRADIGRAHKVSAIAYQAKVWAYMATWDKICKERNLEPWKEVESIVNRLENEFGRGLNPSFSQLWSSEFEDFWNKECCFSFPAAGGTFGTSQASGIVFAGIVLDYSGWVTTDGQNYSGWGQFKPTADIYNEMAKDNHEVDENGKPIKNERLAKSILEYGDVFPFLGEYFAYTDMSNVEAGFQINKYMDAFKHDQAVAKGYIPTSLNRCTPRVNFHMIRFAELMLFRAEACLHLYGTDKYGDINAIRRRSGLLEKTNPSWADLYHERRCELAFEMTDHLHDLKRWVVTGEQGVNLGALYDLAYAELTSHPNTRQTQWSPVKGIVTDKDGNVMYNEDGTPVFDYLYCRPVEKGGKLVCEYFANEGDRKMTSVEVDSVDPIYGYGVKDGKFIPYYARRNNPGAEWKEVPYPAYETPVKEWKTNKIAFKYSDTEITASGGLYKQVEY